MRLAVGAMILTFATAITAGFLVYQFTSNLSEKMKTAIPPELLRLESAQFEDTCLTVYARNLAAVNIGITEALANGTVCSLGESVAIPVGVIGVVKMYGTFLKGETYSVEIVPSVGVSLVFNIKYE